MTSKIKPPDNPADCHTDEQKWAYVHMLRKRWAAMGDKPSEILDFPAPIEGMWWTRPEAATPQAWKRIQDDGLNLIDHGEQQDE